MTGRMQPGRCGHRTVPVPRGARWPSAAPMLSRARRLGGTLAAALTLWSAAGHALAAGARPDPDQDWQRRSRAPGVVIATGFDAIQDWVRFNFDRSHCNRAYQVKVDGRLAGCRDNAWDPAVRSSGAGSVRFDILSRSNQGSGGNIVIPFGEYYASQFGARDDLWVSWRQRMSPRFLQPYAADGGKGFVTAFKQVIIGQGDIPGTGAPGEIVGQACSEAQIVVVSTPPGSTSPYPQGYIECARYLAFEEVLKASEVSGDARGSVPRTRQNERRDRLGRSTCVYHPRSLDQSGCKVYRPDTWMTFMVHISLGPEGEARSSVSGRVQPGYVDSTYELYMALDGEDFELLHRQDGIVIPRGQYFKGGDAATRSNYAGSWGPGDAHPKARYGKLWLLPYMTGKDPSETTETASTWYDEVIVSRCRIAAPGHEATGTPCRVR